MAILLSIIAVNSISAVTDNKTDAGTGGGNGSSSAVNASFIAFNTAVCGPDVIHLCQTLAER